METPALVSGELCGSCHGFALPNHTPQWPFSYSDTPAQSTVAEWQDSYAAAELGLGCADCHLPRGRHTFPGADDDRALRRALAVTVVPACNTVDVTVQSRGLGHALPTGDPFRQLVVTLYDDDCEGDLDACVVGEARFARTYRPTDTGWVVAGDTRVPVAERSPVAERTLTVNVASRPGRWMLRYRLADPRTVGEDGLSEDLAWTLLSEGTVRDGPTDCR